MATTVESIDDNSNGIGKRRSTYINWDKDVFPSVYGRLTAFENERVKPTVRGLLYVLESMNVLKKNDYNGLSKHLVEWRDNSRLPIDCVADNTRQIMDIHQYLRKSNYSPLFIKEQDLPLWFARRPFHYETMIVPFIPSAECIVQR
jgi:hypothetical protein